MLSIVNDNTYATSTNKCRDFDSKTPDDPLVSLSKIQCIYLSYLAFLCRLGKLKTLKSLESHIAGSSTRKKRKRYRVDPLGFIDQRLAFICQSLAMTILKKEWPSISTRTPLGLQICSSMILSRSTTPASPTFRHPLRPRDVQQAFYATCLPWMMRHLFWVWLLPRSPWALQSTFSDFVS